MNPMLFNNKKTDASWGHKGNMKENGNPPTATPNSQPSSDNSNPLRTDGSSRTIDPTSSTRDASPATPSMNRDTMKSCSGFALSEVIMGGSILKQTFVSNDMGHESRRAGMNTPSQPDSRTTGTVEGTKPARDSAVDRAMDASTYTLKDDAFRGLSFISFNEQGDTYQSVFMDSRGAEICTRSGTFDASTNRLVFTASKDASSEMSTSSAADSQRDIQVVVEILSNDQYRVTMYHGDMAKGMSGDMNRTKPNNPARLNESPAKTNESERNEASGHKNMNAKHVMYTATYTRATGSDIEAIRKIASDRGSLASGGDYKQRDELNPATAPGISDKPGR